ncbi:MAG: AAA family ATPase, partial [Cyanobacteriota bacterium]|nr:AAA family ATPase [Cyanobacteriota bacterium]
MQVKISIKNYRCFSDSNPARIVIRNGFTAFIGINNSGKSSLLKFFYEFREIFHHLSHQNNFIDVLNTQGKGFNLPREVSDSQEVFYNLNNRDLEVIFELIQEKNDLGNDNLPIFEKFALVIPRNKAYKINLYHNNRNYLTSQYYFSSSKNGNVIARSRIDSNSGYEFYINDLLQIFSDLSKTFYIGQFRNAISSLPKMSASRMEDIDANYLKYYDIKVGRDFIRQWAESKIGSDKSRNLAIIQLTEDIKRIFDIDKLEINASNDYQSLKLFIEEQVYNLSELGSGLAQFILVMANLLVEQPVYILIDEPELNLHPML